MRCPNCKRKISEHSDFCEKCGYMLEWDEITDNEAGNVEEPASAITSDNTSAKRLSGKKKKIIIISAVSVLILILLCVVVLAINGNNYISTKEKNAQEIEMALIVYYEGAVTGSVFEDVSPAAAPKGSLAYARKEAVNNATVGDAPEWAGLTELENELDEYLILGNSYDIKVHWVAEDNDYDYLRSKGLTLTSNTKLGEYFG